MNGRTPLLLALLAVLATTVLYFALQDPAPIEVPETLGGLALEEPPEAPAAEDSGALAAAPTPSRGAEEPPTSARTEAITPTADADAFVVPDDARWLDGRVVFPDETPHEESATVVARGKRFGKDRKAPRERTVEVARDGTFRAPFSEDTTKGILRLEASYLYLKERVRLDLDRAEEQPVLLQPVLGGRIVGRVVLPPGVEEEPDSYEGIGLQIYNWRLEGNFRRGITVEPDGTFVLPQLPPSADYSMSLNSNRYRADQPESVHVTAGEDLELTLQLTPGVRVTGTVLDAAGEPISGVIMRFEMKSENSSHNEQVPVKGDGTFDKGGLEPGTLRIEIEAPGYSIVEDELGELKDGDTRLDLAYVPTPGRELSGRVTWRDGTPAEGARVVVKQANEDGNFDWTTRELPAEADAKGEFVVEGLDDRPLIVEASHRQLLPPEEGSRRRRPRKGPIQRAKLTDVSAGQSGLLLVLGAGHSVRGKVVDDRGQPVTAFAIEAQPVYDEYDWENSKAREDERVARFDDELGGYELRGLGEGRWKLRAVVSREGRRSEWLELEVPQTAPADLVAARSASISGVVRTPSGEPAAGARVELAFQTSNGQQVYFGRGSGDDDETTDSEGRFEFEAVRPGKLHVDAELDPYASAETLELDLLPAESREGLVLQLQTGARITGVVHASSDPVEGRRIHCWGPNTGENTISDAKGEFAFEGLPPGDYHLRLDAPDGTGGGHDSDRIQLVAGGSAHVVLGAPPEAPIRVTGRVTQSGKPAPGVSIGFHRSGDSVEDLTDADGQYEVVIDGPGQYNVSVSKGGQYRNLPLEVGEVSSLRHDIDLPTTTFSGVVYTPDGEPAKNLSVTLARRDPERPDNNLDMRQTWSEDGAFRFEFLEAGEYVLRAGGQNWGNQGAQLYGAQVIPGIELRDGEQREGFEVRLTDAASIRGVAVDASGAPAANHWLQVQLPDGTSLTPWTAGRTLDDGTFELKGMPAGELTVTANGPLGKGQATARTAVGQTSEVRIVVEPE